MVDMGTAAAWYREATDIDPENSVAKHLPATAEGTLSHEHANAYATRIFAAGAQNFGDHFLKTLNYRSPHELATNLAELQPNESGFSTVLDLGCVTGLMVAALASHFEVACHVGADLSKNMLDAAGRKNLYQELIQGDLVSMMSARSDAFDFIVSTDVFIYVGEISECLHKPRVCCGGMGSLPSPSRLALRMM
jgi:predicted TPR repeat methyltransferase